MPKTYAESVRKSVARARERARAAGLCCICFKQKPNPDRTVCTPCTQAKTERKKRSRERARQAVKSHRIFAEHEKAGDRARKSRLFDTAAQHYREALNVGMISQSDHERLVDKFGYVSLMTNDPASANGWHAQMLDSYIGNIKTSHQAENAIRMLWNVTSQMWIESQTQESLQLREKAVEIAERFGTERLRKKATLKFISYLMHMGRFSEASEYLDRLQITDSDSIKTQTTYYWRRGFIAAANGLTAEAYEQFETAVQRAMHDSELGQPMILRDYAIAAMALGDIEKAQTLCERSLLVVRRNRMGWYIPLFCLDYANVLARQGQQMHARGYLLEALASNSPAPVVEEHIAAIGIPIALLLNDDSMVEKCSRFNAIEIAFRSREPALIGPIASSFACLFAKQNQLSKAQAILHRAIEYVTYVDESLDFPIAIAQHGLLSDVPAARALLTRRLQLPSAEVAQACLALVDALVARRKRKREVKMLAAQASAQFEQLRWYAYADLARSLIPASAPPVPRRIDSEMPLAGALLTLTDRESQVVELVLRGFTNRAIAQHLAIREHTVEKHMGSIMGRLGIRSRHQLADALPATG